MPRRLKVTDINPHVICTLCDGYLVDATAIIECLHAFCRTCIVEYLQNSFFCPVCDVQVHKTRPLLSIRSDQTLQDLVYKMVPGLYQNEMKRRRDFYRQNPETRVTAEPELRGEGEPRFFSPKESISLSLHHRPKDCELAEISQDKDPTTRHLSCPAAFTVGHLKKFIHSKFSLPSTYTVDIFYEDQLLRESYSLMDVAYIYSWKRAEPMKFFYNISKCIPKIVEPVPAIPPATTQEMDIDSAKCDSVVSDNVIEVQTCAKEEIETMQVDELPRLEDNEKIDQNVPACPSPMALPPSPPLSEKELAVSSKENIIPPSSNDVQPMDTTESEVTHSSLPEKLADLSSLSEPSCDMITPSSVPEISSENVKTSDFVKESNKTTDVLSLVTEQCNSVVSSSTMTKPASNSVISQPSVPITTCNSILISSSVPQTPYNSIAISTPVPEPSYNSVAITSPVSEPTYNSVKLVSTPEGDTVLSPTNGFKLKFIHDPELIPKSRSKKSGRKARSSRHKNVPVRLARLAPYPPPPPPPVPVTCLTTQPLQHLPQFTVGKLVPSVITTLAPTFVTTLVSTTSNSLCNVRNDSSASQVSSFLNQQSTISSNVLTHSNGILPPFSCSSTENDILTSSKNTSAAAISSTVTIDVTSTPAHQDSQIPKDTKELSCTEMASENNIVIPSSISLAPVTINENSIIASESPVINTVSVSFSSSDTKVSTAFVNSFDSAKITPSSVTQTDNQSLKTASLFASLKDANPSEIVASVSANLTLPVNADLGDGAKSDSKFSSSFIKEQSPTFESMTNGEENGVQTLKSKDFKTVDHNSESFMRSVKNSISAEFSDNDDLGCPPDLVVDEQKMDSSDNEDDTDVALRKKINAIAEKEDETDVTDDTEADSGRASDMSCPARCEEDIGSPATTETVTSLSITTSVVPTSSVDSRHTKSNNIDHVIKQLYLQHEIGHPSSSPKPSATLKLPVSSATSKTPAFTINSKSPASPATLKSPASPATLKSPASPATLKPPASPVTPKPPASSATLKPPVSPAPPKDDSGVLDLSTCIRKSNEMQSTRQKPVANPVMDIKHRKQPYLPAPARQHTVCPPAPKHPTSSLLMHQLTTVRHSTPSILQAQLTGNTKSYTNHPQSISFVNPGGTYALQGNRNVSSPSPLPVRPSQSTYSYSFPQYSGMLPYPIMDMASYAARSGMVSNMPPRSSSSSLAKEMSSSPSSSSSGSKTPSFISHSKLSASTSRKLANTFISSAPPPIGHCRVPTVPSPTSAPAHPRTSPSVMTRMSPHHRSASPAPSPQNVSHSFTISSLTPTTTASTTTTTTTSSQCKPSVPIYKKSESSHKGFKLKKNANLTVFNPDPNGFSKLVIKNLDSRSSNHHK